MFSDDKRSQAWLTAFVGVPISVLWPLGSLLAEEPGMRVLYGGVSGLLGAAIGLGLYALVGQQPVWNRVVVLLTVVLLGLVLALAYRL
ncbi:MAG: hypothetical protein R2817_12310 [Flavobacteriales bacterium]